MKQTGYTDCAWNVIIFFDSWLTNCSMIVSFNETAFSKSDSKLSISSALSCASVISFRSLFLTSDILLNDTSNYSRQRIANVQSRQKNESLSSTVYIRLIHTTARLFTHTGNLSGIQYTNFLDQEFNPPRRLARPFSQVSVNRSEQIKQSLVQICQWLTSQQKQANWMSYRSFASADCSFNDITVTVIAY